MPEEKEEIATAQTMIRKNGNVFVTTIPSKLMSCSAVKKAKGTKQFIRLVRKGKHCFLEIALEVRLVEGRFLEIKRE